MVTATSNLVPGIDADCGGGCACGTCHVIIEDKWFKQSGEILETESQMLGMTPEREATSRLSCQIKVTDAMDGMKVRLPEFQM
jgi:2Fe-2S ferredoxin